MKKIKIILTLLLAILLIGSIYLKNNNKSENKSKKNEGEVINISFKDFQNKINNKDDFVLVITQEGCSHCKNYLPVITNVSSKYNIDIYDISLTNLNKDEIPEFNKIANVSGTPTTLFFKDGEEQSTLNRINGETSETKLVNKLKKLGYIGE